MEALKNVKRYRSVLMGFAALWIFIFHEWLLPTDSPDWLNVFKRIGFCGVDIFFLLSGIGLCYAIGKHSVPAFYGNRLRRIWLPFVCMGVVRFFAEHWEVEKLIKNLLPINFYLHSMYSFLWFVPAILSFYLFFPLYYGLQKRAKNPLVFWAGAMMLWLLLSLAFQSHIRADLYGFTNRIPVFITGVLLGDLLIRKEKSTPPEEKDQKSRDGISFYIMLVIMLALGIYLSYRTNYAPALYILVPASNCCIPNLLISVSLVLLDSRILTVLSDWKPLHGAVRVFCAPFVFYGTISLELYCVQEWLCSYVKPWVYALTTSRTGRSFLYLFICTAAACFLYLVRIGLETGVKGVTRFSKEKLRKRLNQGE